MGRTIRRNRRSSWAEIDRKKKAKKTIGYRKGGKRKVPDHLLDPKRSK